MDAMISARQLHQALRRDGRVEVQGWPANADGDVVWLTNPYGVDVGFYDNDERGCARLLAHVAGAGVPDEGR